VLGVGADEHGKAAPGDREAQVGVEEAARELEVVTDREQP
jgi:hypothetical protein